MTEPHHVALIEDDEDVLDSLRALLSRRGYAVSSYATAKPLLQAIEAGQPFDCIVSDIRLPVMTGTALNRALKTRGCAIPVILITGHGDVDLAVQSMKSGVFDFIEKPIESRRLLSSIRNAILAAREARTESELKASVLGRFQALTDRQKTVMRLIAGGLSNKEIAAELALSPRTIEHYREWVMEKMRAGSLAELVQMAVRLELLQPAPSDPSHE